MRTLILSGLMALAACGTAAAAEHKADAAPGPIVTPLSTHKLPDYPGKEVLVLAVDFPPGSVDPVHRHDAHAFVYVLEGSIVMGVKGGQTVTLKAGDTFYEGPQDIHTVGRNASKEKPAKFVVFMLKDIDKPPVIHVD